MPIIEDSPRIVLNLEQPKTRKNQKDKLPPKDKPPKVTQKTKKATVNKRKLLIIDDEISDVEK